MKTYEQLTPEQQEKALTKETLNLLQAIMERAIGFNDELNGDNLQARIDKAIEEAEDNRTPWFAGDYVMKAVGEDIKGMAQCTVEDALYSEPDENVIDGIID